VYHSTLGVRVIKKKKEPAGDQGGDDVSNHEGASRHAQLLEVDAVEREQLPGGGVSFL